MEILEFRFLTKLEEEKISDTRICCKLVLNLGRIGTLDAILNFEV